MIDRQKYIDFSSIDFSVRIFGPKNEIKAKLGGLAVNYNPVENQKGPTIIYILARSCKKCQKEFLTRFWVDLTPHMDI